MDTPSTPPAAVIEAFATTGEPVLLRGGRGATWRAGSVILKPVDFAAETNWRADVLEVLPASEHFRIARPVRTVDGTWIAEGWEACQAVDGPSDLGPGSRSRRRVVLVRRHT